MFGFFVGVAVGIAAKVAYDRLQAEGLRPDARDYQRRAAALLDETRQLLKEIREKVVSATETARERAGSRIERLRGIATSTEVHPPAQAPGAGDGTRVSRESAGQGAEGSGTSGAQSPGSTGGTNPPSGSGGTTPAGQTTP
jgi:hypothetical protein